jgi:hypothetical protein
MKRWFGAVAFALLLAGALRCGRDVELGTDPRSDAGAGRIDAGAGG